MGLLGDSISFLNYVKQAKGQKKAEDETNSIEYIIYNGLLSGDILVCRFCCGFVDKECGECPHCGKKLGLLNHGTLAIKPEEVTALVTEYINEGKYIGRYSRGDSLVFDIT